MKSAAERIAALTVASVYPHYVTKVEKKGRSRAELDQLICWLTGFRPEDLQVALESKSTFKEFFSGATVPAAAERITGLICGVRIESIEDPLEQLVRRLDKIVDEMAQGRPLEKIINRG